MPTQLKQEQGGACSISSASPLSSTDVKWMYIRNLSGIIRVLFAPFNSWHLVEVPSLGTHIDEYVYAHGYTHEAILEIKDAAVKAENINVFTDLLTQKGLPLMEARYLWRNIDYHTTATVDYPCYL